MRRVLHFLTFILLIITLTSCNTNNENESSSLKNQEIINTEKINTNFIDNINSFQAKLYSSYYINNKHLNTVVSGMSLYNIISMIMESGTTNQYANILDMTLRDIRSTNSLLNLSSKTFYYDVFSLDETGMYNREYAGELKNNNTIIMKSDVDMLKGYMARLMDYCSSKIYVEDFNDSDEVIYTNELYFSNIWSGYGKIDYTNEEYDFTNINGSISTKKFLLSHTSNEIKDFDGFSLVVLDTFDIYKLKLIVPKDHYCIEDVYTYENILLVNNYINYVFSSQGGVYNVKFPEFKVESDINNEELLALFGINGIELPFSNKVKSRQKNILEVNDKGINAPVVSYSNELISSGNINKLGEIIINRPFGYIISNEDNVMIYSGVINNIG